MNLVIVSDYGYSTGGIEQFIYEMIDRLPREISIDLLTWRTDVLVPSGFVSVQTVPFGDVRPAWDCLDRADVVLVVTSFNVRLLARLVTDWNRHRRARIVTVVQTSQPSDPSAKSTRVQREWLRDLIAMSESVVAVSEDVRQALLPLLSNVEQRTRVVMIENGARLGASGGRKRRRSQVAFVGRPHPQKGFDLFQRLAVELMHTNLQFAANTVSVPAPERLPGIEYSDNLGDAEMLAFFERTDLLLAPYLRADGLPLVLLEALNCGVPILGFDSPGVAVLLRRYHQVVITPSYEALRDAVLAWSDGTLRLVGPSANCVQGWDTQVSQYAGVITAAAAGRRARSVT